MQDQYELVLKINQVEVAKIPLPAIEKTISKSIQGNVLLPKEPRAGGERTTWDHLLSMADKYEFSPDDWRAITYYKSAKGFEESYDGPAKARKQLDFMEAKGWDTSSKLKAWIAKASVKAKEIEEYNAR